MGENSAIAWCNHTFNPWIGCQKVSDGCDFCYAETLMDHRYGRVKWGPHGQRVKTSPANWRLPIRWNAAALKAGVRHRVFCASLADWLDNKVPRPWRSDLGALIKITPALDWLLLTKRPENFKRLVPPWHDYGCPDNVWFGFTAENQEAYNRRWPIVQKIKARVRFVSYEPALGPIDLPIEKKMPDWIIYGGESGGSARDNGCDNGVGYARSMRDQCGAADIAFFMKQTYKKGPIPDDLMIREFPYNPTRRPQ